MSGVKGISKYLEWGRSELSIFDVLMYNYEITLKTKRKQCAYYLFILLNLILYDNDIKHVCIHKRLKRIV